MNLKTQRKLNWLKQVGGDEAIEALGAFVEKASEYATINNIPYKDQGENKNMEQDILDNVQLDIEEMSKEDVVENSAEVEAITSLTEPEVETEIVEKETSETEEVNEPVVENQTQVVDVTKEDRPITFKELSDTIDTFVNEVFSPLMEVVKELREANVQLTERLNAVENKTVTMKEVQEDLEIVPTASVASLIKERIVNRLDGLVVTKESIADEKLTEQKPVENVSKNENHFFADFVSGL